MKCLRSHPHPANLQSTKNASLFASNFCLIQRRRRISLRNREHVEHALFSLRRSCPPAGVRCFYSPTRSHHNRHRRSLITIQARSGLEGRNNSSNDRSFGRAVGMRVNTMHPRFLQRFFVPSQPTSLSPKRTITYMDSIDKSSSLRVGQRSAPRSAARRSKRSVSERQKSRSHLKTKFLKKSF